MWFGLSLTSTAWTMASRDFLGVFAGGGERGAADGSGSAAGGGESDEIELSLGLSLGGRFGTDMSPDAKRARLARSSSIASVCSVAAADGDGDPSPLPLLRTSSLPTETEEERWRRREMQNQRRLEARRKRLERRISVGVGSASASASAPTKPGKEDAGDRLQLRRSIGTQGSSSANPQEQGPDGTSVCQSTEAKSPSTSDDTNQNSALPPAASTGKPLNGTTRQQPPLRTLGSLTMRTSSTGDIGMIMMDMPMVSSKVEGPNGRKIDGFLYKYRKGEDVSIMCVCHGKFHSPAEFVKHAGGGDVSNPLRHIVVNPSPSVFL
uniref:Ninja-family protein n=2 Tax=Leersia perrieri TaxID=77586 RepID=A0A0D9VVB8_9ORYZ